ncbi:hypothetical protein pdam_00013312 [Pocillopora damicornis]|uniref:Calponin-homology (CH) domain-containing protein n=1 Tax=Pocillopora damicornis TaxID=46731 RepID=A0A3M6UPL2_POCDA|nr:uncharacterized protein LOC113665804 isoform X1 [Pocillopora damicornis]XP_027037337.1 uncharacterized protein LOC113665804 isoform X1 [Pocillopora damicornis]XP_027037343.1 uncharacterized protein LOC113665804 isoform X1 [Pocillopora damicornis]RMX55474.1 hypothetical protein pdam_00013312 [Pocillopora damicornis]
MATAFTLAELEASVSFVNSVMSQDSDLECLPIKPAQKLYQAQKTGVLFCKLLNRVRRGTVPCSRIHKQVRNIHQALENQKLVLEGTQQLGIDVHNVTAEDLWSGKEYLVLEVLWKIVRVGLLSRVNVENHPNLVLLRRSNENWPRFVKLSAEELLIRWVNYQLRHTFYRGPEMTDFNHSLKDSVIYSYLFTQLSPQRCSLSPLDEEDLFVRAKKILSMAELIGCNKYITPHELVKGNPRLNLAFLANLFHCRPGLEFHATDMESARLIEELNTAHVRCRLVEEERNLLMEVRREMSGELKDVRKKLEESLKEMEILKRRALGLEDENKYLTDVDEAVRRLKAENSLLQIQLTDSKAVEDDSQATIANQEITIDSLKKEKEALVKEYEEKINELENKISATTRKQTKIVLQKEAIMHERDLLKRKHDKCQAELKRLQAQIDRRQRHVHQLRQLFKYFISDKGLAEKLYGNLDTTSLQSRNGKSKVTKFCQEGGWYLRETAPQIFLLKDNFLFVFDREEEDAPLLVLRLDQATVNKQEHCVLQLKFSQKEFSYHIKVSPASYVKDLQQELEVAADWWTERQRTSPCSRFKEIVQSNMLTSGGNRRKLNLRQTSLITADV